MKRRNTIGIGLLSLLGSWASAPSGAEDSSSSETQIQEVIVTAQKRSESANSVGMSISAVTGDALVSHGIQTPSDLPKLVSGFTYTEEQRGTPTYAIRGIGFNDSSLGATPTVALYTDEVPLSFPVEARFATLDLERVEVLKGPQGTLFGQNSTAGAINFIAAKPTDSFKFGADGTYGRFNATDLRAFVSGPLTDTLRARVAVMGVGSDGWQESYTRSFDDKLGAKRQFAGRLLVDWTPSDSLTFAVNVNGWKDRSNTLAGQYLGAKPQIPGGAAALAFERYPPAPQSNSAADWDPNQPLDRDDEFFQTSIRADYHLSDSIALTSISAYSYYNQADLQDADGTALTDFLLDDVGSIRSFDQEIRLAGSVSTWKWIVGGDMSIARTLDTTFYRITDSTASAALGFDPTGSFALQHSRDKAAFFNLDWAPVDLLEFHGGMRYTDDLRTQSACTHDVGDGRLAAAFNGIVGSITGQPGGILPGGCITLSPQLVPQVADGRLEQNNVSWRVGADLKLSHDMLLYANVSKGYKSGSFPAVNATTSQQYDPVQQESVLAYEVGTKASLFDRSVQLNAALFYDDYTNKQLRGRILDQLGVFGVLEALVNVPKSRVEGVDLDATWIPAAGLKLRLAGTYVESKVTDSFNTYDPFATVINLQGLPFPDTPKWNANASIDYDHALTGEWNGFAGVSAYYRSATTSDFLRPEVIATVIPDPVNFPGKMLPGNILNIAGYTTVDAQLGVSHGEWRAWLWGRNIFDKHYWNNATAASDVIYRLPGMPATFGVSASVRF